LQSIQRSSNGSVLNNASFEESLAIIDRTIQQVRNLSLELRPSLLDDLGVVAAIRWYVDRQAQRAGFKWDLIVDPPEMRLKPDLETTCFRLVQEAITNVVRHAQASLVQIELRQHEKELELIIRDDGVGFDVRAAQARSANDPSLGLVGMEERVQIIGGRIEITSSSGDGVGTEIRAHLPLSLYSTFIDRRTRQRELE
jgi:signal transduction histidine kinase